MRENESWKDALMWFFTPLSWLSKDTSPKAKSVYISLMNPISLTLLVVMLGCFVLGLVMVFNFKLSGFILLAISGWIATGFDYPKPSPKQVWLLTIFGQKTTVRSYGLTLLLPPFIDKVEISLLKVDHDFPLTKQVVCTRRGSSTSVEEKNPSIEGYIDGIVSVSIVPDDQDDPYTVPKTEWKSGGQKLRDYDNVGQIEGVKKQLDDVLTAWIQEVADTKSIDMLWMETNGPAIAYFIRTHLVGLKDVKPPTDKKLHIPEDVKITGIANAHINDARGLGVTFPKFNVVLKPSDQKVIDARNRVAIEEAQRSSQIMNTRTMNEKIIERATLYHQGAQSKDGKTKIPADPRPETLAEIRAGLVQEDLVDADKATLIMNKDGLTVAEVKAR